MTSLYTLKTSTFQGPVIRNSAIIATYKITGYGLLVAVRATGKAPATPGELRAIRQALRGLDLRATGREASYRIDFEI